LGQATRRATDFISKFILGGGDKSRLHEEVAAIVANPSAFVDDPLRGEFAKALLNAPPPPRAEPVKYRQWGEGLEHDAVMQMEKACLLPVSVAGALMPDAHVGYGLPIGGVLATDNAVIPYAVGVDIACRMKMTVLDIPVRDLEQKQNRLTRAIEVETRFGVGANFKERRAHGVLDADWSVSPITKQNKDKAWSQLGTSGSGNHFVEFGSFTAHSKINDLEPGVYVALLSHSGSRGTGASVCDHSPALGSRTPRRESSCFTTILDSANTMWIRFPKTRSEVCAKKSGAVNIPAWLQSATLTIIAPSESSLTANAPPLSKRRLNGMRQERRRFNQCASFLVNTISVQEPANLLEIRRFHIF